MTDGANIIVSQVPLPNGTLQITTTGTGTGLELDITSIDSGAGLSINVSLSSDVNSTWSADTYQLAFSFVYDNNQESLLHVPSSSNTFVVAEGEKVSYVSNTGFKDSTEAVVYIELVVPLV